MRYVGGLTGFLVVLFLILAILWLLGIRFGIQ